MAFAAIGVAAGSRPPARRESFSCNLTDVAAPPQRLSRVKTVRLNSKKGPSAHRQQTNFVAVIQP